MARKGTVVALEPLVAELAAVDGDEVDERVLDAAASLMGERGIGGWTVEDVAERSRVGRTTVYRRFDDRDRLVHTVLAREARRFFVAVGEAVAHLNRLDDQVVEGLLVAIRAAPVSLVGQLLARDAQTLLPLLTTEAGPLVAAARTALVELYQSSAPAPVGSLEAEVVADALVRLGLSLVLSPSDLLDLTDDEAARWFLGRWVRPLLGAADERGEATSSRQA